MDQQFLTQVIISFFVGGLVIALQSLVAERVPKHIAGLIMSVPTTYAIGLFFLGWILGAEAVGDAFTGLPLGLGASFVFVSVYLSIANAASWRYAYAAAVSFCVSTAAWLLIAVPFVLQPHPSLRWSLVGFAVLITASHYCIAIRPKIRTQSVTLLFTRRQVLIRALVAGVLTMVIVLLGKTLGPVVGGLFAIFPATYSSTCLMVHRSHGSTMLYHVFHTACFGSVAFLLYGYSATITFPLYGIWVGTALAYIPAVAYLVILQKILQSRA